MSQRDPLRFRKSEVRKKSLLGFARSPLPKLPKPRTAREFAFCILDEHKQSRAFISDLLDDKLDRQQTSFIKRPPLGSYFGKSTTSGSDSTAGTTILSKLDRRFVTELTNGIVRRQSTLDAILRAYITRPRHQVESRLWTLLQMGVYQLILMTNVPPHAAVGETVELARFVGEPRWCGFLNGVLRSIARDLSDRFEASPAADRVPLQAHRDDAVLQRPAVVYRVMGKPIFSNPATESGLYIAEAFCLPGWLLDRWTQRFPGDGLLKLAEWFACRQPLAVRVNRLKTTRDELLAQWNAALGTIAVNCCGAGNRPASIWYDGPVRIVDLPGFAEGHFTVQDETAMAAAELLNPQPGECVLDLCAAPGTKTTHLAELMKNQGQIIAADSDFKRLRLVEENAERLGLTIIEPLTVPVDTSDLPDGPFDAVLVDVPCSNTGVLGKRPEVRSRLQPHDINELAEIQSRLLRAAAQRLKPGGRLVYSTCSIEPEENTGVVQAFLDGHSGFELVCLHEFLPGQPSDGGFQALIKRLP